MRVETVSSPCPSRDSTAFRTRLRNTCVSCARSPRTSGRLGSNSVRSTICPQSGAWRWSARTSFRMRWMFCGASWRRGGVPRPRSCSTRPSSRSTSRMITSVAWICAGSLRFVRRSWAAPLMPPSGLRISCARPRATEPSAASWSARRVVVSSARSSVRSCSTSTAPRSSPCSSCTGAHEALTETSCPRARSRSSPRRRASLCSRVERASSANQAFAVRPPKSCWMGRPIACDAAMPMRCSAAGLSALRMPAASSAITPSEMLARTSAQRRRSATRGRSSAAGPMGSERGGTLEIVLAARVVTGRLVGFVTRLELVHHLVEVLAGVLAQLLAHLAHPACNALRVVLVQACGVVPEPVHARLVRPHHGEARHQPSQIPAPAAIAGGRDLLRHAQREHGDLLAAATAPVLVDRHGAGDYNAACQPGQRPGPALLGGLGREALLTVGEGGLLAVHHGLEDDVAAPEPVNVGEGALRILELEIATVVGVRQEEGPRAAVVGVLDPDDRNRAHADALQQQLLHGVPTLLVRYVADHEIVAARLHPDEIEVTHQPLAQPATDERGVAVDLARLEQEVAAVPAGGHALALLGSRVVPAALDVLPHAEPEVVRVETAGDRANHLVVADEKLKVELLGQVEAVEDALVPERGPNLVHDLGLDLRNEGLRGLVDDGEEIALPVGQERIVVADEEEDVLLG